MMPLAGRRSIAAEIAAAATNLLVSAISFCVLWLSVKRVRLGVLAQETRIDLALTVLLYLPLTFVVVYCAWRLVWRHYGVAESSTRTVRSLWFPGMIMGVVLGLLDASVGVLRIWTPLFRRLIG